MKEFYRDKMERLEEESEDQLVQEAYELGMKEQLRRSVEILKAKYDQCGEELSKVKTLEDSTKLFNRGMGIHDCIAAIKGTLND